MQKILGHLPLRGLGVKTCGDGDGGSTGRQRAFCRDASCKRGNGGLKAGKAYLVDSIL